MTLETACRALADASSDLTRAANKMEQKNIDHAAKILLNKLSPIEIKIVLLALRHPEALVSAIKK